MRTIQPEAAKLKVFVFNSRSNSHFADQLCVALTAYGIVPAIDRNGIHRAEQCANGSPPPGQTHRRTRQSRVRREACSRYRAIYRARRHRSNSPQPALANVPARFRPLLDEARWPQRRKASPKGLNFHIQRWHYLRMRRQPGSYDHSCGSWVPVSPKP